MKAVKCLTTLTLTTSSVLLIGVTSAQQMSFTDASLASGNELEAGSAYRFSSVTSGIDAVVTVDALTNVSLLSVDQSSTNSVENAAWRPTFAGTGGSGLHYADFTVLFYANGTNTPLAPDAFTTTVLGNDLSAATSGFMMEFTQVAGYSSMIEAEQGVDTITYADGSSLALSSAESTWLAAWNFEDKPGYTIRFGWQGDNGNASGRTFGALLENTSGSTSSYSGSQNPSLTTAVPEPSISILIVLSAFPLALRRTRT